MKRLVEFDYEAQLQESLRMIEELPANGYLSAGIRAVGEDVPRFRAVVPRSYRSYCFS